MDMTKTDDPTSDLDISVIRKLGERIYDIAFQHGWYDESRTFGDRIALCHSELSEALEEHRNGHHMSEVYYKHSCALADWNETWLEKPSCTCTPKPEGIPIELADTVIRILDMCAAENIDIVGALQVKVRFNNSRPYRHGGKAL